MFHKNHSRSFPHHYPPQKTWLASYSLSSLQLSVPWWFHSSFLNSSVLLIMLKVRILIYLSWFFKKVILNFWRKSSPRAALQLPSMLKCSLSFTDHLLDTVRGHNERPKGKIWQFQSNHHKFFFALLIFFEKKQSTQSLLGIFDEANFDFLTQHCRVWDHDVQSYDCAFI